LISKKDIREFFIVLGTHTLLALIATFPLIINFNNAVVGGGDSVQNAWNFWWFQRALGNQTSPFFSGDIYWPDGVSLAFHTFSPLNNLAALFFQVGLGMNLVLTFNTIAIASFILTGASFYYLAKYLVHNSGAAIVASIIFTFSPIRMSRVHFGNLGVFSTMFIPLAVLFTHKALKTNKWKYFVLAAIFLAAMTWTLRDSAFGLGLFLLAIILIDAFRRTKRKPRFLGLLSFIVIAGLLSLPAVWPMISDYAQFQHRTHPIEAAKANNADLLGFFIPDRLMTSVRLGKRIMPVYFNFVSDIHSSYYGNPAEKTVFVGYVVILLVLFALVFSRNRDVYRWSVVGLFFLILALSPTLFICGKEMISHLPYEWFFYIPLINFGRNPSRLTLFMMTCLAILSGYGLATLEEKFPRHKKISLIFGVLIFCEFLTIPMSLDWRFSNIPSFYDSFAKHQAVNAILDVPVDLYGAQGPASSYMLYQTVHEYPIVGGYISREPEYIYWPLEHPFIHELRARLYNDTEPYNFSEDEISSAIIELQALNVSHVILHRDEVSESDFKIIREALASVLGQPFYEDDFLSTWEFSPQ